MNIGRNEPCYCGSGKKYKKCCLVKEENEALRIKAIQNAEWEEWFKKDLEQGQQNLKGKT